MPNPARHNLVNLGFALFITACGGVDSPTDPALSASTGGGAPGGIVGRH